MYFLILFIRDFLFECLCMAAFVNYGIKENGAFKENGVIKWLTAVCCVPASSNYNQVLSSGGRKPAGVLGGLFFLTPQNMYHSVRLGHSSRNHPVTKTKYDWVPPRAHLEVDHFHLFSLQ